MHGQIYTLPCNFLPNKAKVVLNNTKSVNYT